MVLGEDEQGLVCLSLCSPVRCFFAETGLCQLPALECQAQPHSSWELAIWAKLGALGS